MSRARWFVLVTTWALPCIIVEFLLIQHHGWSYRVGPKENNVFGLVFVVTMITGALLFMRNEAWKSFFGLFMLVALITQAFLGAAAWGLWRVGLVNPTVVSGADQFAQDLGQIGTPTASLFVEAIFIASAFLIVALGWHEGRSTSPPKKKNGPSMPIIVR